MVALWTSTPTSMTVVDDEHVDVAGREGAHRAVLVVGGQPPVEDGDPQPGERSGGELGVDVLDGGERAGAW